MTPSLHDFSTPRQTKSVELTSQDLEDAARILSTILEAQAAVAQKAQGVHQRNEDAVRRAESIVEMRERRSKFFNASMFGEPAWDVLLALYLAEARGLRANVNTLTRSAGVPATTALRWMDYLENQKLICRQKDPTDARVSIVRLTEKARRALEMYLLETLP